MSVTISIENTTGIEGGNADGMAVFTVRLSEASTSDVTVSYRTIADGSARDGAADFFDAAGILEFAPGELEKDISVRLQGDFVNETDENFTLELHSAENGVLAGGGATLTATGIIADDDGDANNLALFVSDPRIVEGNAGSRTAVFEVALSEPSSESISFNYMTADGTAIAGEDYNATSGTVIFAPGQTIASVEVDVLGDTVIENSESFSLVVTPTNPIQNGTADSTGIATIADNDSAENLPIISIENTTGEEGGNADGEAIFTVRLSKASTSDVSVSYRTVTDGSARDGDADFFDNIGVLQFNPGETQKTISVRLQGDFNNEPDENFELELFNPEDAVLAGGEPVLAATGVIRDDDGDADNLSLFVSDPRLLEGDSGTKQAVFEVTLSRPAEQDITLDYMTADGTARAGEDYTAKSGSITFKAGQTVASVAVDVLGDTDIETVETFSLVVEPNGFIQNDTADSTGIARILDEDAAINLPVITIENTTGEEGGNADGFAIFTVRLSKASTSDVSVSYRTVTDGSARDGDADFFDNIGVLQFDPGETQKTISVRLQGDFNNEPDENFELELFSPEDAVLAGGEPVLSATGVIRDDDGDANNLSLFVSDPRLVEGDSGTKQAVFEVTLSRPAEQDITLNYMTVDGTATAGEDYTAKSGSITFKAGQTIASVEVDVRGDSKVETIETFSLVVEPNGFIQNDTADSTGIARIIDEDTEDEVDLPVVTIENTTGEEGGNADGEAIFTVRLSEASTSDISVSYRTVTDGSAQDGDVDFFAANDVLNFAPGETQKTISVRLQGDFINESDENFTLELSSPQNAVLAGGESRLSATGVIRDDDGDANNLALFVTDPRLVEGNIGTKQAVFEVTLSRPLDQDITLNYATIDGTARAGQDYTAKNGSITFKAGQTIAAVAVDVSGDFARETNETFSLSVTPNGFIQNGTEDSIGIATIIADEIVGTNGRDTLIGTDGPDAIFGLQGRDVLEGREGRDLLNGGGGRDRLSGEEGNDRLLGSAGSDTLDGGSGRNVLNGGKGVDTAVYNVDAGVEVSLAVSGFQQTGVSEDKLVRVENLTGGNGRDVLTGNGSDNALTGRNGGDTLNGAGGNDDLSGGKGADRLSGGNGMDDLTGGRGRDVMTGGSGSDNFIFNEGVNEGRDRITDFRDGSDSLVLIGGDFSDVQIRSAGGGSNTRVVFDDGTNVLLEDVRASLITEDDFTFL
ncbi:MAG: Calx-beta domain-containing protein [Arenibacterium sp.]